MRKLKKTAVKERNVAAHLVQRTKEFGGEIRKVKWEGRKGAPDRRVMIYPSPFWVETKRPGKVLEPHQEREIARMRAQGEHVEVFDSAEVIDRFLIRHCAKQIKKLAKQPAWTKPPSLADVAINFIDRFKPEDGSDLI